MSKGEWAVIFFLMALFLTGVAAGLFGVAVIGSLR